MSKGRSRFPRSRREYFATKSAASHDEATAMRDALGRFKPVARPAVVVVETRQQRRHKARMLLKAAQVWSDVTNGAGVVLVDGKEVAHG